MLLPLVWLDPIALHNFYFAVILLIYFQKTWFFTIIYASEQLDLFLVYLYSNFELIRSYFTTWSWVDVDSIPCIVFCIVYTYIFRFYITETSTNAVDVSIIETTTGCTSNCNRMVSNTLPGVGSNVLPLAWLDILLTVKSSDYLYLLVLNHCPTESASFVVHILLLYHSAVLQV